MAAAPELTFPKTTGVGARPMRRCNIVARSIRRVAALVVVVLVGLAQPTLAADGHHLSGGGTASISQVAMNVNFSASGSVSGTFECLMAGRSAFVLPGFGLAHSMIVHASPTAGSVSGTKATFSGIHHIVLNVRDLDTSVRWYSDVERYIGTNGKWYDKVGFWLKFRWRREGSIFSRLIEQWLTETHAYKLP